MSYAAVGGPNQVVSASSSPSWVSSPTQATYPSGRINTAVGAATAPIAGSSHVPTYLTDVAAAAAGSVRAAPIVSIKGGAVRGVVVPGGYAFRGLPYAAAPTGRLRWRAPRPATDWNGVRDASQFAPSCPQQANQNLFLPPGPIAEDCLYLNVSTPTLRRNAERPVLVWIHGGGLTQDAARNYDGSKLAAAGTVVVTINYRLGALGFLAHPALASRPGGPTGNYGLMDQQAALRWVRRNIEKFGGDPRNVTIAGQSAGGLSVLAHLVSRGSRGLFQRAIVQSGAFALKQQPLAEAKAFGQAFATSAGCADQSAECLRALPVSALIEHFPGAAIPGVVDGRVLTESIGTALAGGRFARVPILNGINHDEEFLFVAGLGVAVSGGTFVLVPERPVTAANYQRNIAAVLSVPAARAAAIAAEYPLDAYPAPIVAFSTLVSDANFACPALQVDRWTSTRVRVFAYQFNDDSAPQRFAPPGALPPIATHSSELQYVFDLPNTPVPATLNAGQEALARSMRAAWASFAASGDPSTAAMPWPSFNDDGQVMSLVQPQSQVDSDNASRHHCAFWSAG
jgi:para-nitrobenzyl esterase